MKIGIFVLLEANLSLKTPPKTLKINTIHNKRAMLRSLGGGQTKKTHKNNGGQSQSFKNNNKRAMLRSLGGGPIE